MNNSFATWVTVDIHVLQKFLLVDVAPCYDYKNGVRSNEIACYR